MFAFIKISSYYFSNNAFDIWLLFSAKLEGKGIGWKNSLLSIGCEEVSNALYAYQTAVEKQASRTYQVAALEKAVDYTKQLLQYSSATNYTDVLTSEQSLLLAQLNGANDKLQQLQAVVELYRALGGGWQ